MQVSPEHALDLHLIFMQAQMLSEFWSFSCLTKLSLGCGIASTARQTCLITRPPDVYTFFLLLHGATSWSRAWGYGSE